MVINTVRDVFFCDDDLMNYDKLIKGSQYCHLNVVRSRGGIAVSEISVIELTEEKEFKAAFPLIRQLRTHLNEAAYLELIKEAVDINGYRMFGLIVDDQLAALTGFMPMTNLYDGRSIWVCDLVTDERERSKGYGEILLHFVQEWAADHGYEKVALSSGLKRTQAHRFYVEHMDYERASFVFKKDL